MNCSRTRLISVLAAAAALCIGAVPAHAAAVQFDTSLGAGYMTVDMRGTQDIAAGVAVDAAGRIVVGATSSRTSTAGPPRDAMFARLSNAGVIDTTFGGSNDRALVTLPESAQLIDFAMAPASKIVGLARGASGKTYLFRLNADGSLDTPSDGDASTHFGTNGVVTLDLVAGAVVDLPVSVAVETDGKVVIASDLKASAGSTRDPYVRGFTNIGAFDFDVSLPLGTADSFVTDLAVSPAGDRVALVAQSKNASGKSSVGLLVLETNGDPDLSFSGDGKVVLGSSLHPILAENVTFRFDGRVVVSALEPGPTGDAIVDTLVVRWTTGGTLDHDFSGDGLARSTVLDLARIRSTFVTSTGRIVAVGRRDPTDLSVMRMTSNGALDTGLDGDGGVSLLPPAEFAPVGGVAQTNGRTLVVGIATADTGSTADVGLVRLTSAGVGDTSFGNTGLRRYPMSQFDDRGNAVTIAPDGGLIVAGFRHGQSSGNQAELLKLLPSGYRDPSFGQAGRAFIETPSFFTFASDVAMRNAKPVFAGCDGCFSGGQSSFLVGRLTAAGIPDTGFDGDGLARTTFDALNADAQGVAVQPDGMVVAVGTAGDDFAVARLTAAGQPDLGFSGDGRLTTDIDSGSQDFVADVALQGDGKIVVAGSRFITDERFAVVRYKVGGGLDLTFGGGDGIAITKLDVGSAANALAIRPDGRIIVVGETLGSTNYIAVARYRTDGTLDPTFSGDGKLVLDLTGTDSTARAVAAVGNKIVISGRVGPSPTRIFVARLNGDGTLDPTFSADGFEIVPGDFAEPLGMAIAADGDIVVAGVQGPAAGESRADTVVARFNP